MGRIGSYIRLGASLLVSLLPFNRAFAQAATLTSGHLLPQLDALAGAAKDPSGRSTYVGTLMTLAGGDKLAKPYYSGLSKRLELDEERVRRGKQAPVSETSIAMAFNQLALILNSPVRVDAERVHRYREIFVGQAPNLISINSSPSACNPGEAVFLVYIIAFNDGSLTAWTSADLSQCDPSETGCVLTRQVSKEEYSSTLKWLAARFAAAHTQVEVLKDVEAILSMLHL